MPTDPSLTATLTPDARPWLTVDEVSRSLAITPKSVRKLIRNKLLTANNVSTGTRPLYRVHIKDLEAFRQSVVPQEDADIE